MITPSEIAGALAWTARVIGLERPDVTWTASGHADGLTVDVTDEQGRTRRYESTWERWKI